jgi:phytoene synthase
MTDDETEYCEDLVREADKDRFLATLFAPGPRRPDLYALYAFDLETASVSHRVRDPMAGEIRLQWWSDALAVGGDAAGHPVATAMTLLLQRRETARELASGLIDARRRALYPGWNATEAEFELWASQTAGAVFDIATQVLQATPGEAARLAAHHAGVAAAAAQVAPDAVPYDIVALSRRHREAARALMARLPDAVLPAFLPLVLVVDDRVRLPQWRKQLILWRASRRLARWI